MTRRTDMCDTFATFKARLKTELLSHHSSLRTCITVQLCLSASDSHAILALHKFVLD